MPRKLSRGPHPRAVEPLSREALIRRSSEAFPSANLTFISIIQGVALGYTIYNCVHGFPSHGYAAQTSFIARAVVQFTALVIISWEYTWFGIALRWPAGFVDTLVPLTLGAFEIIPTFYFGQPFLWWLFFALFLVSSLAAYVSSLVHCKRDMYELENAWEVTRKELRADLSLTGASLAVAVAELLALELIRLKNVLTGQALISIGGCACVMVLGLFLVYVEETSQSRLYHVHGLSR